MTHASHDHIRTVTSRRPPRRGPGAQPNAIDTAREAFAALVAGPDPISIEGWLFRDLPDRLIPLDELRDQLLVRECPQATRDAVWVILVARSRQRGAAWTLGAVGVALPALTRIASRLSAKFAGDPADVHAAILSGFLAGLAEVDLARPRVMLRLRWAAYRAGHAAVREALDAPVPTASRFHSAAPLAPWGHPDLVLADAVSQGVITTREADLIGATRLDDVTVTEWAAQHETTNWMAYKLRRSAEQRLVAHLLDAPPAPKRTARASAGSKTGPESGVQTCPPLPSTDSSHTASEDPRCA